MVVKVKVSKSKRNNQKRNKLVKQGVIKKGSKIIKNYVREQPPKPLKKVQNNEESEESDHGEDMLEMVEDDDLEFIKNAISKRSYSIFNQVKYTGPQTKIKQQKLNDEDETLENEYESQADDRKVKLKNLLPIKTSKGVVPQQVVDYKESDEEKEIDDDEHDKQKSDEEESEAEYTLMNEEFDITKPISAAQLLATRNEVLRQRKIHIGTLSSGLLENPEDKVTNLRTLLKMMDEEIPEIYLTIQKLVIVSLLEVFRDILPSYEIKTINQEGVKLKKDTLKLQKYEENLLQYYKKYLQRLEKYAFILVKKKGDSKKRLEKELELGELAVRSMCELLVSHPYFNFSANLAQAVVPFLNSSIKSVREIVQTAIKNVFRQDKKEEITLKILRIVNQYLKKRAHNVNTEMLEVLLVLNLRDVNLDQEKELDIKQKKQVANKQKILQMSKKERKRKKKLLLLEKEMLETKAEENKQAKQQNLTEITKIVFNIYFRILKSSTNTKVLGVCLEGLAKFAHCINLEFYVDIVNVVDNLLKEDWLNYRERLHCIQTVFAILGGQGEALNLDPTRFYTSLYQDLLSIHASRNHDNFLIVLKTIIDALVKRRKKITNNSIISFVKRLATLSLQLLHNGSLGGLGIIKNMMQLNKSVDILLDLDNSVGDGKFQADLNDPEYSNASNTALYEMIPLSKHYHPLVAKYARHIASGVPATGDGSLPSEYGKLTPQQLYEDFSMSEMAFNPSVPVPKKFQAKSKSKRKIFADSTFESECKGILKSTKRRKVDFWISC